MKRYGRYFILGFLVFFVFMAGARMFFLDTMLDSDPLSRTVQSFIKKFFLYKDFDLNNNISSQDLMICFTAFLFMGYNLNIFLYGITRKYRSMILLRYGARKKYFLHNSKSIISKSLMITAVSVGCFCLASWINSIPFDFSESEFASSILLIINLFFFLNLLGLINIYCVMKYKDTTALIITTIFTSALLLADAYEPIFAIITYGKIQQEIRGVALLAVCNIILYFVAGYVLKKNDIL